MKKLLFPFFLLVVLMNACKKDDTTNALKPSETPVTSLLTETDWVSKSYGGSKFEVGYIFSTTTKGKITQLSAQMGEPGVYSVSVWDVDTKKLLRQKSVEQTSPNKFSSAPIDELVIEKDKKYLVSINTTVNNVGKSYNELKKSGSSTSTIFPISRGSVLIQKSVYLGSAVSIYPTTDYSSSNAFYGFADFTFIPD